MAAGSRFVPAFVACMAFWMILTYSGLPLNPHEIGFGAAISLLAASVCSSTAFQKSGAGIFSPKRWLFMFAYVPLFIKEEIVSHWSVIKLIATGKTNPAIVRVPVHADTAFGRMIISNSITLTPGTFVLKDSDCLYVHCLDYMPGQRIAGSMDRLASKITEGGK